MFQVRFIQHAMVGNPVVTKYDELRDFHDCRAAIRCGYDNARYGRPFVEVWRAHEWEIYWWSGSQWLRMTRSYKSWVSQIPR